MTRTTCIAAALVAVMLAARPVSAANNIIPIIDVHDQWDDGLSGEEIVRLMDAAGVQRLFLAARLPNQDDEVLRAAEQYPGRIFPLIRTKGDRSFEADLGRYLHQLSDARRNPRYVGLAELLVYHAVKPQIHMMMKREIPLTDAKVTAAASLCESIDRPLILHIEAAAAPPEVRKAYMDQLGTFLDAHPRLPVLLIHMAQLDPPEVERLIAAHPNAYFIPSTVKFTTSDGRGEMHTEGGIPWTVMFGDGELLDSWRTLFVRHPDRFVYGSDNVMAHIWRDVYVREMRIWRRAFQTLPPRAAHMIAHENAERLWHLGGGTP